MGGNYIDYSSAIGVPSVTSRQVNEFIPLKPDVFAILLVFTMIYVRLAMREQRA